ncbi:MAG: phosphotransferase, partial [Shinella sp.]
MNDMLKTTPDVSLEAAAALLAEHYGLSGTLSPLASERDQNFKVETPAGTFILKIVNAAEPAVESDFQTALLAHVDAHAGDLPVPHIRPTVTGASLARITSVNGVSHRIRLVSWVDGQPLAETDRSDAALESLGRMLGRFDAALKGFMHPGALRDLDWDIRKAGRSAERLHHVSAAEDRALLQRFLARFAKVAPRLATLRAAVIHNDANDWNVLVDPADQDRISGLIDFGDALHAPLIAEVAIASAYAGLDHADPIGAAAAIAR